MSLSFHTPYSQTIQDSGRLNLQKKPSPHLGGFVSIDGLHLPLNTIKRDDEGVLIITLLFLVGMHACVTAFSNASSESGITTTSSTHRHLPIITIFCQTAQNESMLLVFLAL